METFSALLAIFAGNSPVLGEFPAKKASDSELWCFLLICVRLNGLANNEEAGDLTRHRAHYDVTVMITRVYTHTNFVIKNGGTVRGRY